MLRQRLPRNILGRTGICLLAVVLLASAGVPKAQAQATPYDKDKQRFEALAEWISGAWSFVGGVQTAIEFLTGAGRQRQLTIEDIKGVIDDALVERHDMDLTEGVQKFAANFHDMALDASTAGHDPMLTGELVDPLFDLRMKGVDLFEALNLILQLPSDPKNDQRVATVLPAYTVLVPLLVSTRNLLSESRPGLRSSQDQQNSETLAKAQQRLFMAAGAYTLYAYEPGPNPPNYFYSPVAEDRRWMWKWPLYAYHYRDPYIGGRLSSWLLALG